MKTNQYNDGWLRPFGGSTEKQHCFWRQLFLSFVLVSSFPGIMAVVPALAAPAVPESSSGAVNLVPEAESVTPSAQQLLDSSGPVAAEKGSMDGQADVVPLEAAPPDPTAPLTSAQALRAEGVPAGEFKLTPLQRSPIRLFNLETANQLDAGELSFSGGIQTYPGGGLQTAGGGRQIYSVGVDGGVTNRLQLGVGVSAFKDGLEFPINGQVVRELELASAAPYFKFQILRQQKLKFGVSGSVELLRVSSDNGVFAPASPGTVSSFTAAGSLKFPLSYAITPQFQVHFTPAVAFFPDRVNNASFYGTFVNLGAGFSWQPVQRFNLFADLNAPLGPGGNTVSRDDGSIVKRVVWSAGVRYLIDPGFGLDLFATNSFGTTQATELLAYLPASNSVAVGARLVYTPDIGQNYFTSFSAKPRKPLTERDRQLLLDGLTLSTANTVSSRMLSVRAGSGSGTGFALAYGLTNNAQLEIAGEDLDQGVDIKGGPGQNYSSDFVIALGAKLRLLDQSQGAPLSLAVKGRFAQGIVSGGGRVRENGILEVPFTYEPISRLALFVNPKVALLSNVTPVGIGLGFNYRLWQGFQLIGEFTPIVTGERSVWSAGLRYFVPKINFGVDLYGSNAAGQYSGIGSLVAQDDPTVGFNVHWLFGGAKQRPVAVPVPPVIEPSVETPPAIEPPPPEPELAPPPPEAPVKILY